MAVTVTAFDPNADLIVVVGELRGPLGAQKYRFALDTACAETLVTPESVDRLGYSAREGESMTAVTTALGREPGYRLRVSSLKALGHAFTDFRVNVHDLPDSSGLDGLIGLNFLRAFNYEIRSKEGRILVSPA
ncbi:MAG: clan AA aspartic protease [Deltaproteobacteria bacterium]|nr:clan AA aspartic protease [Deltaproteobacteria bacterium]